MTPQEKAKQTRELHNKFEEFSKSNMPRIDLHSILISRSRKNKKIIIRFYLPFDEFVFDEEENIDVIFKKTIEKRINSEKKKLENDIKSTIQFIFYKKAKIDEMNEKLCKIKKLQESL